MWHNSWTSCAGELCGVRGSPPAMSSDVGVSVLQAALASLAGVTSGQEGEVVGIRTLSNFTSMFPIVFGPTLPA